MNAFSDVVGVGLDWTFVALGVLDGICHEIGWNPFVIPISLSSRFVPD